jgi:hypothetical protein
MKTLMLFPAFIFALVGCSADQATNVIPDSTVVGSPHSSFFVTVNGTPAGDGTADHPWDLVTALNQPAAVHAGDTIWLHGGTYQGNFTSKLTGTAGSPIVLREYPGERSTIDGPFLVSGQYAYYWGFELTFSDPQRVSTQSGSAPTDIPRAQAKFNITGASNKLINLIVHDRADGMFAGRDAVDLEVYGSVFYNNGWVGPDRGHGHNLYMQNDNGVKHVFDNVLFDSFDIGLQIYGSDVAYLWNFDIEGNSVFNSGDPVGATYNILQYGGDGHLGRTVYRNNSAYHRDGSSVGVMFGYPGSVPGVDIQFLNNFVQGQSFFFDMNGYVVTGNKFYSPSSVVGFQPVPGASFTSNTWTNNTYSAPATGNPFQILGTSTARYQFPGWQSTTGYDVGSSFVGGQFNGDDVIVRPNQYEPGRAFVTVWNWDGASTVSVDLSTVLKAGDQFDVRNVFDLFGTPVLTGTYTGNPVSITQSALAPPTPIGYSASPAMPNNHFNVFLVQKH